MYAKLALSFAVSALIVAIGGFFAVLSRLDGLERATRSESQGRPPALVGAPATRPLPAGGAEDPLESKDVLVKLDYLIERLDETNEDLYEFGLDAGNDFHEMKREIRQLKNSLKQVVQGLAVGPGGMSRIGWGLTPKGAPLDEATAKAYTEEAGEFGIQVKPGEVRVRGFLNMSPNVEMPIEYFMTRFPHAGHETLVHLIGNKDLEELGEQPYTSLKGLSTALYKALLAAGFEQGEPTHPDPTSDRRDPRWILATGDTMYVGVRYELDGEEHVALATDWVRDPNADSVLPPDAFRFTGSVRGEDPDTGDEILASELMGLLVSVYPTPQALAEVALSSAQWNNYTYNFSRIPKPDKDAGPLYLDVIFSKTPIELVGDGAKPIERPAAVGTGTGAAEPR